MSELVMPTEEEMKALEEHYRKSPNNRLAIIFPHGERFHEVYCILKPFGTGTKRIYTIKLSWDNDYNVFNWEHGSVLTGTERESVCKCIPTDKNELMNFGRHIDEYFSYGEAVHDLELVEDD